MEGASFDGVLVYIYVKKWQVLHKNHRWTREADLRCRKSVDVRALVTALA